MCFNHIVLNIRRYEPLNTQTIAGCDKSVLKFLCSTLFHTLKVITIFRRARKFSPNAQTITDIPALCDATDSYKTLVSQLWMIV